VCLDSPPGEPRRVLLCGGCAAREAARAPSGRGSAAEVKRELDRQRPSAARRGYGSRCDDELLRVKLADLSELSFELGLIGFGEGELERLLTGSKEGLTEDAEAPPLPEQAVTQPGDVWVLGEHRLLRGDATVLADLERMMDGQQADMTFTDPPCNLDYGTSAKEKQRRNKRKILNDNLGLWLRSAPA
jgi:hypothetical protein